MRAQILELVFGYLIRWPDFKYSEFYQAFIARYFQIANLLYFCLLWDFFHFSFSIMEDYQWINCTHYCIFDNYL